MSWTNLLGNKQPVESMYSTAPPLAEVRLHEVRQHQDGPRISMRIDLNAFPDKPPKKWIAGKLNRAQLTLVLIDVQSFQMNGWGLNNVGDLKLVESENGVNLQFISPSAQIECSARFLEVEEISGYFDSETAEATA